MITVRVKKLSFFLAGCIFLNTLVLVYLQHVTGRGQLQEVQTEFKTFEKELKTNSQQFKAVEKDVQELKTNYEKLKNLLDKEVSFKEGLQFVLAFEGGLSNDEADSGGLTNLGITHSEYDQYRAQKGLPFQSVANITLTEASDIYKQTYWLKSRCGDMPRRVAISCFDWQVNAGRGVATLQQVLGGIDVDGIAGPETFNELNSWLSVAGNENKLLHNYFSDREDDYRRWGVGTQAKFLGGWLRRAEALKDYLKVP